MPFLLFFLCAVPAQSPTEAPIDAAGIMAKVAANVERATGARKQYVYHQFVRSSLVRSNGVMAHKEKREYSVFPAESRTEKKLISFAGEYRKGKQTIPYKEPGYHYQGTDIDGDLMRDLTDSLVDDKTSRDGIPHSLFPIATKDLPFYTFKSLGIAEIQGRRAYRISFEPRKKDNCIHIGGEEDDECEGTSWKGEAWIDAEELQPIRIQTDLAFSVPWGIRVFLGTNLRQTGFSVNYVRVGENVWFPSTYGTEFRLNVLWGYKRTVTLSMESNGFQKTDASSKIDYQIPE
jgi:hypothetical protein